MERLNLLLQQERAARTVYEGEPVAQYLTFYRPSLPPADPPPKTQTKKQQQPDTPVLTKGDSKVGLVRRPLLDGPKKGQMYWRYPLELLAEAEQMLARGVPRAEVARCTDVSYNAVVRIERQMKLRAAAEAPVSSRAVEAVRRSAPSAEPQRLYVLEWADRFSRIEFTQAPEHCQPNKGRSRGRGYTPQQIQQLLRSNHAPSVGMSINTKPRVSCIAQSIATLFAGAGSNF